MIVHLANPPEASSYVSEAEPQQFKPISVLWGNYGSGLGWMTHDRGDVCKENYGIYYSIISYIRTREFISLTEEPQ